MHFWCWQQCPVTHHCIALCAEVWLWWKEELLHNLVAFAFSLSSSRDCRSGWRHVIHCHGETSLSETGRHNWVAGLWEVHRAPDRQDLPAAAWRLQQYGGNGACFEVRMLPHLSQCLLHARSACQHTSLLPETENALCLLWPASVISVLTSLCDVCLLWPVSLTSVLTSYSDVCCDQSLWCLSVMTSFCDGWLLWCQAVVTSLCNHYAHLSDRGFRWWAALQPVFSSVTMLPLMTVTGQAWTCWISVAVTGRTCVWM